jgi:hypothetical protein
MAQPLVPYFGRKLDAAISLETSHCKYPLPIIGLSEFSYQGCRDNK